MQVTREQLERILNLADQFLQDWKADHDECDADDIAERTACLAAARPLLLAAPELLAACMQLLGNAEFADGQGTILTTDAETLEAVIASVKGGAG